MELNKNTKNIILSVALIIIGILFCLSKTLGLSVLSYIIGISMIIAGGSIIVSRIIEKKYILNASGLLGGAIIAFGILFAIESLAALIFYFIPWLLIVLGVLIVIDGILKKINENLNAELITELIVGAIVFTIGLCLKLIPAFAEFSALMLGIVLIIYGIFVLANTLMQKR